MAAVTTSELYEWVITKKAAEKANELGIEFKVQHFLTEGTDDIVCHIKRDLPVPEKQSSEEEINQYIDSNQKLNIFTDYISDLVVGNYANQIRFNYPTTL